jgi:hypothetical protein
MTADFKVNTLASQGFAEIDMLGDGTGVVVYQSGTSTSPDIRGQMYSPSGSSIGTEFLANMTTTDSQMRPHVALDPSTGGFVVAWQSTRTTTATMTRTRSVTTSSSSG